MTKYLCIYHADCADGFAGAWAARHFIGADRVDFHPGRYGEAPPDVTGRAVILVDFSYPRSVVAQLAEQATHMVILDHHKTAIEALADFAHPKAHMVLDASRSGARIAWDYFATADEAPPPLLQHIEDRDLWRFAMPNTREIMAALFSHPQDFATWDHLMSLDDLSGLVADGHAIERKHAKDIDMLLKTCLRHMVIGGYTVPAANLPFTMASDAAGQLAENMPFAATFYDTGLERVFSLRSRSDGLDVAAIAQQYGGGGHRNAAGFRVPLHRAGIDVARLPETVALPGTQPENIGVDLAPDDLERLENAITKLQAIAPALDIDDCINLIFFTGLTMAESPGGIEVVSTYGAPIQAAKETA